MDAVLETQLLRYVHERLASYFADEACVLHQPHAAEPTDIYTLLGPLFQYHSLSLNTLVPDIPLFSATDQLDAPMTLILYYDDVRSPETLLALRSSLAAWRLSRDLLSALPMNICWLLNGGGSAAITQTELPLEDLLRRLPAPVCLWSTMVPMGHVGPVLALGTKGRLSIDLTVRTADHPLPGMSATVAPNALWRLLWALGSLKDVHEEILVEGFYDTLVPADDDSVQLLHRLPDTATAQARGWGLQQPLLNLHGFQFHYTHLLIPGCTITGLSGGHLTEMNTSAGLMEIPETASAQVEFSLVPMQDPLDIWEKCCRHFETQGFGDIQATLRAAIRPTRIRPDTPFVQGVERSNQTAYGMPCTILPMSTQEHPLLALPHLPRMPMLLNTLPTSGDTPSEANVHQFALLYTQTKVGTLTQKEDFQL